jgi:hypothetical protein
MLSLAPVALAFLSASMHPNHGNLSRGPAEAQQIVSRGKLNVVRSKRMTALPLPHELDTLGHTGLARKEIADILAKVAATSFDTVDDWQSELRARRSTILGSDLLIVRGHDRLCGQHGNCQTWLFERVRGRWAYALSGDPPVASRLMWVRATGASAILACSAKSASSESLLARSLQERSLTFIDSPSAVADSRIGSAAHWQLR